MADALLVRLLLRAHVAAASLDDDHMRPEKALCGRVLLVLSRTQCATQLVAALIAQLRQYDATAPPADVPAHAWAGWRAGRAVRREPLTATERSAFELCLALPYETAAMMLEHLGFAEAATCITEAIDAALAQPALRTADLGGTATTESCGKAIADMIRG